MRQSSSELGPTNFSIFSVAKKARSFETTNREEMLLTSIIAWSFERSTRFLEGFLTRAFPQGMLTGSGRDIRDSDPLDVRVEEPAYLDDARYRFDLILEWSDFQVVLEFKVIPGALASSQLETYHRVLSKDDRKYAIVVVSPDASPSAQTVLGGLQIGKERTFHLPWAEVYDLAAEIEDDEERSGDNIVAHEVKVAIGMAPGLKPFAGFGGEAVNALQNMDEADRQIGQLFTAIRGILTAPAPHGLELSFQRTHAEDPPAFRLPASIWDEYVDPDLRLPNNVSPEAVIMGPWFRLDGKRSSYCAYLETTSPQA